MGVFVWARYPCNPCTGLHLAVYREQGHTSFSVFGGILGTDPCEEGITVDPTAVPRRGGLADPHPLFRSL